MTGLVTVLFSDKVMIPANYTSFNSSVINLLIKKTDGKIDRSINYTWNVTDFSSTTMLI